EGSITVPEHNVYNFMVINVSLQSNNTQFDISRKISAELRRQIELRNSKLKNILNKLIDFIQRIEVIATLKINPEEKDSHAMEIIEEFTYIVADSISSVKCDGVLVMLDEADNVLQTSNIGSYLKTFVESLGKRKVNNVFFVLAGLPAITE